MNLAEVGERAVGSTSVGGSWWGGRLGVGVLRQRMRSAEGLRALMERGVRDRVDFVFLDERRMRQ
jgi:hypothetical protein